MAEGTIDETPAPTVNLRNLRFKFFDSSGLPRDSRILMFYSFDHEDCSTCSGILHYHVGEGRFVGPRQDRELTDAALAFLARCGRLAATVSAAQPSNTP